MPLRLSAVMAMLALAGLGATAASAAPQLGARPAFAPLRAGDPGCAIVTIENDGIARRVQVVSRRLAKGSDPFRETVSIDLDLPAHARKRVFLPVLPSRLPEASIEIVHDGMILSTTVVDFGTALAQRPSIAAIGPAPQPLAAHARLDLQANMLETAPADLPAHAGHWPPFAAVVWDAPRSADISPDQARALRSHVLAGACLIVAASPEEPEALATLGLSDLLPASVSSPDSVTIVLGPAESGAKERDGLPVRALEAARGLGRVVLVAGSLDDVPGTAWQALTRVWPPEPETQANARRRRIERNQLNRTPGHQWITRRLVPEPPTRTAGLLLGAFLIAAVPVDGWLTRRSLRAGRRSRYGALRYPAIVVVATALAFSLAHAASGMGLRTWRVDVIDVGPDGLGVGRSFVHAGRARAGVLTIEAEAAHLAGVGPTEWEAEETPSLVMRASADPSSGVGTAIIDLGPWQRVGMHSYWTPDDVPAVLPPSDPCGSPTIPACDGAATAECGSVLPTRRVVVAPLPAGPLDLSGGSLLGADGLGAVLPEALLTPRAPTPPDLVLAFARRLGPEILLDGRSTDGGDTVTLVRYRFPEGSWPRPAPPPDGAKP